MSTSSHEGYLLRHTSTGENGLRLDFLTVEDGLLTLWKRQPTQASLTKSHRPDLFCRCALTAAPDQNGQARFIRELRIIRSFPGLGQNYRILHFASRMARVILQNPFHEESPGTLFATVGKALEAWESPQPKCPEWIFFKFLYLYAREEGFPVKEEWQHQLLPEMQSELRLLLHEPVTASAPRPSLLHLLRERLEAYLSHIGEVRF